MNAVRFKVENIDLFERAVTLRMPFRFGVATLRASPQAFARVRLTLPSGRSATGASAELLAPKWFDKRLELSNEQNFADLRRACHAARRAYLGHGRYDTAFGYFAAHYQALIDWGAALALNPLLVNFGPSLIERAVLDALCRACDCSVFEAMSDNLPGLPEAAGPNVGDPVHQRFVAARAAESLAALKSPPSIAARHTVGLVDAIVDSDPHEPVADGLPESLESAIRFYGIRHFKLKVAGQLDADLDRLERIAHCLDRLPNYVVTLDGNEQYADAEAFTALMVRLAAHPRLQRLYQAIDMIEQPITRKVTLTERVDANRIGKPMIIDESDGELDDFPRAVALGYQGVSSKGCKGLYKSLLNAARCRLAADSAHPLFMSAEDLTTQAGLAVQQDLALAAMIGMTHVERNGHHYVDGFGTAPATEVHNFLRAHSDLYAAVPGSNGTRARLRIENGRISLASLYGPGYASAAHPDFESMTLLRDSE